MRDITSAPYYVNKYACDGKNCRYTGIKIVSIDDILYNDWEITIGRDEEAIISIYNTDITGPTNNSDAAQLIYNHMKTMFAENGIRSGLDILCITSEPNYEYPYGCGIIYVKHGYTVGLKGAYTENIDYLKDGDEKADIYNLCRNISINFGACKDSANGKYSNIYSGKKIHNEGGVDVVTWPRGSIPLIMSNCKLCERCVTGCPRKAICNKINNKPESLTSISIDPLDGSFDQLYRQYASNSQAKNGDEIYT